MGRLGVTPIFANAVVQQAAAAQPAISQLKATYEHVVSRRFTQETNKVWDIRNNVPGEPGVDYPTYSSPPETSFTCGKQTGYFADVEARCQVFRVCANTDLTGKGFAFLCPNGTLFNQKYFVCDWWKHVNCSQSNRYFGKNSEMGHHLGSVNDMMDAVQKMVDFTKNNGNPYQMMLRKPSADQNNRGKSSANTSATEANRRGGKLPVTMATISAHIETPTTPKSQPISNLPKIKNYVNPIAITKRPTSTPDLSHLNPKLLPNRTEKAKPAQRLVDSDSLIGLQKPSSDPVLLVNFLGETMPAPNTVLEPTQGNRGNNRFTVKPFVLNLAATPTTKSSAFSAENRRPTQLPPVSSKLPQYQQRKVLSPLQNISIDNKQKQVTGSAQIENTSKDEQHKNVDSGNQAMLGNIKNIPSRSTKRPALNNDSRSRNASSGIVNANNQNEARTRIGVIEKQVNDLVKAPENLFKDAASYTNVFEHPKPSGYSAEAVKPYTPTPQRGDQGVEEYEAYEEPSSQNNPGNSISDLAHIEGNRRNTEKVEHTLRSFIAKETAPVDVVKPLNQSDLKITKVSTDQYAVEEPVKKGIINKIQPTSNEGVVRDPPSVSQKSMQSTVVEDLNKTKLFGDNDANKKPTLAENINQIFQSSTNPEDKNPKLETLAKEYVKSQEKQFISNLSEIRLTTTENLKSYTEEANQLRISTIRDSNPANVIPISTESFKNTSVKSRKPDNIESSVIGSTFIPNAPNHEKANIRNTIDPNIMNADLGDYLLPPNQSRLEEESNNITEVRPNNLPLEGFTPQVSQLSSIVTGTMFNNDESNIHIGKAHTIVDVNNADTEVTAQHPNRSTLEANSRNQSSPSFLANIPVSPITLNIGTTSTEKLVVSGEGNLITHKVRDQVTNLGQLVTSGEGNILSHNIRYTEPSGQHVLTGEGELITHTTRGRVNDDSNVDTGRNVFTGEGNLISHTTRKGLLNSLPNLLSGHTEFTHKDNSTGINNHETLLQKSPSKPAQQVKSEEGDVLTQASPNKHEEDSLLEKKSGPKSNANTVFNISPISSTGTIELQTNSVTSGNVFTVDTKFITQTSGLESPKLENPATGPNVYSGEGNLISHTDRTKLENYVPVAGQRVFSGEGNLISKTTRNKIADDAPSVTGQNVFTGEGNLISQTTRYNLDKPKTENIVELHKEKSPTVQPVFNDEGNVISHTTHSAANHTSQVFTGEGNLIRQTNRNRFENSTPEHGGFNVYSGEGNLVRQTTRTRIGNDPSQNDQIVYTGEGHLISHTSRNRLEKPSDNTDYFNTDTNTEENGRNVYSGEGNLISYTSRKSIQNEQNTIAKSDSELLHQPIVVPSLSVNSDIQLDSGNKSDDNPKVSIDRKPLVNRTNIQPSKESQTQQDDSSILNYKQSIYQPIDGAKAALPSDAYLPIKGLPLNLNGLQSIQSQEDDALSPPDVGSVDQHHVQQTPTTRTIVSSSKALRPDPVVVDLASWSIQQALNNDRIYRNAGYADRNQRIYRTISNKDIEDINDLFFN